MAAKEPGMARNPRARARHVKGARADGATDDDPDADDVECGMTDPAECSIHGGAKAEPEADDSKALAALLRRLLPRRKDDGGAGDDDLPLAHKDAIRLAHKSPRTLAVLHNEVLVEEANRLAGRCRRQADEERIKIQQHLAPEIVDRAVTLIDDDEIEKSTSPRR